MLAEVQALVTKTTFNVPRRTADGIDFNRAVLLLAVSEKRGGMKLNVFDAYINVIGGLRLDEPGADLPKGNFKRGISSITRKRIQSN